MAIESLPRRAPDLEVNEGDDGLVVFDPATEMVHHLNPSAAVIFDLCDGSRDADTIAQLIGDAWQLEQPPRQETQEALDELTEKGLIRWSGEETGSASSA